jgi:anaerobic selenocysteine-containing dehydrogenase
MPHDQSQALRAMPRRNVMTAERVVYRTCPLCEATCGLEIVLRGDEVVRVRGDDADPVSQGYVCPKGTALGELQGDPDRLRRPLLRRGERFDEVSWEDAFAEVERGLGRVIAAHGREAVAVYLGNPNVHNLAGSLYVRPLLRALGTRQIYSASTVDQMPKHVSSGLLFGDPGAIPVPDLDRTDFLLVLGANPFESNGSLCTAPDFPGRLRRLRGRGGRLIVVDPRRTRTAREADWHLPIRPGTDAQLLLALLRELFVGERVRPGHLADHVLGLDALEALVAPFSPEAVAPITRIDAESIRRLARELSAAPRAAVYGRIGTHTVAFGTLAAWAVDVLNLLTGNLDRPGGAMFPKAAHERRHAGGPGRGFRTGRWRSRVRGLPEVRGELPIATLADEIETPGAGQVRALLTVAGNPVLSAPNGERLDAALARLDFMVSVDPYRNETTRHADVILPPPGPLERPHYDLAFGSLSVRHVAKWSPAAIASEAVPEEEILARLTAIAAGQGAQADPAQVEELVLGAMIAAEQRSPGSPLSGRAPEEIRAALGGASGPERMVDFLLRTGPWGEGLGAQGLSLAALERHPHGLDLGPLEPRLPGLLRTPSGRVELAPEPIVADLARLRATLEQPRHDGLLLVGRRHVRSNNSWMHNLPSLVSGRDRCTLQVHPADAAELGLADGALAEASSRVGKLVVRVEISDDVMPGVASLPHGFGHDRPGTALAVAARRPGVNSNVLSDDQALDPLSGNAVLNGIPIHVQPLAGT